MLLCESSLNSAIFFGNSIYKLINRKYLSMNQEERRSYLIKYLINENHEYRDMAIPKSADEQKQLLRGLLNIRMPALADHSFIEVQDTYLKEELCQKGITDINELVQVQSGIYLWQGDITTLRCDAIVNAANSGMTGCYIPNHKCIDNAIHTFSGIQLRYKCAEIMKAQGHEEETGKAKITPAYNLPCKYIIHTVGPIVYGKLTKREENLLVSCYRSCLELADEYHLTSIAFCCISTGEFHFPNERAAELAIETIKKYKEETNSIIEVIFNVFKDKDYDIYRKLLG